MFYPRGAARIAGVWLVFSVKRPRGRCPRSSLRGVVGGQGVTHSYADGDGEQ